MLRGVAQFFALKIVDRETDVLCHFSEQIERVLVKRIDDTFIEGKTADYLSTASQGQRGNGRKTRTSGLFMPGGGGLFVQEVLAPARLSIT